MSNTGLLGWPVGSGEISGPFGWPRGQFPYDRDPVYQPLTAAEVVVTAPAGNNTKPSTWDTLISQSMQGNAILVMPRGNATNLQYLLDIGIGSAGAEETLVGNLLVCTQGTAGGVNPHYTYLLPANIPAGSRISARVQCSTQLNSISLAVTVISLHRLLGQRVLAAETAGADTTTSGGTVVDPGGSIGVKGAWSQMTASTERAWGQVAISIGNRLNAARTTAAWAVDIGVGPPGGEVVVVADLYLVGFSTNDMMDPTTYYSLPFRAPRGSRIAVRAACGITDATDRLFDAVLYGSERSVTGP